MFFGKKSQVKNTTTATAIFRIDGMHCTSCALNIDGNLEDTAGVIAARTNYAKSRTEIAYDAEIVALEKLREIIESTGYRANLVE